MFTGMKVVNRHRYAGDEIFETRSLSFIPFYYSKGSAELLMKEIRTQLTPDLITKKYRKENETNPMYGHCYHSTQALFYLLDTNYLIPRSGIDYRGDTHWWLHDAGSDEIYDTTADQYYSVGQVPPYDVGRKTSWYGWKQRPHQRTLNLMMKVLDSYGTGYCYDILTPQTEALT
jgi:hypothetical protein